MMLYLEPGVNFGLIKHRPGKRQNWESRPRPDFVTVGTMEENKEKSLPRPAITEEQIAEATKGVPKAIAEAFLFWDRCWRKTFGESLVFKK